MFKKKWYNFTVNGEEKKLRYECNKRSDNLFEINLIDKEGFTLFIIKVYTNYIGDSRDFLLDDVNSIIHFATKQIRSEYGNDIKLQILDKFYTIYFESNITVDRDFFVSVDEYILRNFDSIIEEVYGERDKFAPLIVARTSTNEDIKVAMLDGGFISINDYSEFEDTIPWIYSRNNMGSCVLTNFYKYLYHDKDNEFIKYVEEVHKERTDKALNKKEDVSIFKKLYGIFK